MADQSNDDQTPSTQRNHFESLPLEARLRLWEQIWNRLLAPPLASNDPDPSDDLALDPAQEAGSDVAA